MNHVIKALVKNKARAGLKAGTEAASSAAKHVHPPKAPKPKTPKPKAPKATAPTPPPKPKKPPVSLQQEQLDIKTDNRQKVEAARRNGQVFVPESQGERLIKRQEEISKVGLGFDKAKESIDDIRLSNPGKTTDQLKKESPQFKTSMRVLEGAQAELSSIESNVLPFTPDDPKAFPRSLKAAKELKDADVARNGKRGETHIHHMLPKGMTSSYFERMDKFIEEGLATNKELVQMAEIAKSMKLRTGDAKSNLKVIAADPHNGKLNGIHRAMEYAGNGQAAEISKQALQKQLRKVKSPKELMKVWKEWLETDGRYLKDTAEIWEDLDKLIKEIQST